MAKHVTKNGIDLRVEESSSDQIATVSWNDYAKWIEVPYGDNFDRRLDDAIAKLADRVNEYLAECE
jgi:hypothetical protein